MKLSEHFADWELLSPKLLEAINLAQVPASWYVSKVCTDALEDIHAKFGKSVLVNVNERMAQRYGFNEPMYRRGICTDQECLDAGRKLTSQHRCSAFDITIIGINPIEIGKYIESISKEYRIGGLGVSEKNNFCHLDFRQSSSLIKWTY